MKRLDLLLCIFIFFTFLGRAAEAERRPNILLVLVDDMGWSDIGAFGGEIETPRLDRLAANGLRFTQFHTTSKCFPSRAALLTGLYAEQVGLDESPFARLRTSVTIAAALRQAGYHTFMVGKHHGTDNPVDLGFERYVGLRDGAANHFNPGIQPRPGEPPPARKRDHAENGRWFCFDKDCVRGYAPDDPAYYSTDFYTSRAIAFLEAIDDSSKPFFLYLAYQAPHDPLQAPADLTAKYLPRYRNGYAEIAEARYRRMRASGLVDETFPRSPPTFRDWDALTTAERRDAQARMAVYAAMVDRIDQNLGRLVDHLVRAGQLENTLILFTSDNGASAERVYAENGEEIGANYPIGSVGRWASLGEDWANVSNTPFRYYKNFSYAGGTVSPLIIHWPTGVEDPGRVIAMNTDLIDIFPTLLAVTRSEYPKSDRRGSSPPGLEGMDLSPLLAGSVFLKRTTPVFQRWDRGRSVRTDQWKLLSYAEQGEAAELGSWELYDMRIDHTETVDVAALNPDVVKRLAATYDDWLDRVKPSRALQ